MGVLDPKVKKILTYAGIGALLLILLFFIGRIGSPRWSFGEAGRIDVTQSPTPTPPAPSPSPSPTPLPLAPGRQVYNIRSDSKTPGPAISEATFDPLDVGQGGKITVSVKAADASSMTVTMIDDSGSSDHALTLASGVWTGSWTTESTHNRIYGATIVAKNTKGESRKVELWFR